MGLPTMPESPDLTSRANERLTPESGYFSRVRLTVGNPFELRVGIVRLHLEPPEHKPTDLLRALPVAESGRVGSPALRVNSRHVPQ